MCSCRTLQLQGTTTFVLLQQAFIVAVPVNLTSGVQAGCGATMMVLASVCGNPGVRANR